MTEDAQDRRVRAAEDGPSGAQWHHVNRITPLLNSWQVAAALVAVFLLQNLSLLNELRHSHPQWGALLVVGAILGTLIVVLGVTFAYSYFAWRAMTYAVTGEAVWLRRGIIFRQQRHVRLERIQSVDVVHPLLGRIFGLGRLTVQAAGGAGSSVSIGYLKSDVLWDLRAEIMARAAGVELSEDEDGANAEGGAAFDPNFDPADPASPPQKPIGLGNKALLEAPERVVYSVPPGRLVGSLLLTSSTFVLLFVVIVALVAWVAALVVVGEAWLFALLPAMLPVVLVAGSMVWTRFAGEFNFQAAISADGVRVRRGLLDTRSDTIPPRRVHAIQITQPLLWRKIGWYRVEISQASTGAANAKAGNTNVLLPVGSFEDALLALWLVLPDLGVPNPPELVAQAMTGRRGGPFFTSVSRNAWIFDPLTVGRAGIALTDTSVVVRNGRITRRASFASYQRIQSHYTFQGPWERALGMANISACLVPGPVNVSLRHLTAQDASQASTNLTQRSHLLREAEPPERWLQRVENELDQTGTAESPELREATDGAGSPPEAFQPPAPDPSALDLPEREET